MAARVAEQVLEATVEMAALGEMVGAEALSTFHFRSIAQEQILFMLADLPVVAATRALLESPETQAQGATQGPARRRAALRVAMERFSAAGPWQEPSARAMQVILGK